MEEGNKIEGTEEKPKSLIERFWWVIPPVFLTFVYWPGLHIIDGQLSQLSFEQYVRELKYLVINTPAPMFFFSYFVFGFMAGGMLWIRKQELAGWTKEGRLTLRIIVPIVFGILGHFIGIYFGMMTLDIHT